MKYVATEDWFFDFTPHDVGQYPQLCGINRTNIVIQKEHKMPVEECANMIIMAEACYAVDGDKQFLVENMDFQGLEFLIPRKRQLRRSRR